MCINMYKSLNRYSYIQMFTLNLIGIVKSLYLTFIKTETQNELVILQTHTQFSNIDRSNAMSFLFVSYGHIQLFVNLYIVYMLPPHGQLGLQTWKHIKTKK